MFGFDLENVTRFEDTDKPPVSYSLALVCNECRDCYASDLATDDIDEARFAALMYGEMVQEIRTGPYGESVHPSWRIVVIRWTPEILP